MDEVLELVLREGAGDGIFTPAGAQDAEKTRRLPAAQAGRRA
jgi:hypothetical protein